MKALRILAGTACIIVGVSLGAAQDGWTPLFNGTNLDDWRKDVPSGQAEVVDGEIHLSTEKKGKFFLMFDKTFSDFVFEAEVKMPEGKSNSGFMFRSHWDKEKGRVFGYQAEVDPGSRAWSGALFDEKRRRYFVSPNRDHAASETAKQASIDAFRKRAGDSFKRNDWNHYRIECKGPHIKIFVNGTLTTDVQDEMDASGYFGLQHHGEEGKRYRFRNIRVKEIE